MDNTFVSLLVYVVMSLPSGPPRPLASQRSRVQFPVGAIIFKNFTIYKKLNTYLLKISNSLYFIALHYDKVP